MGKPGGRGRGKGGAHRQDLEAMRSARGPALKVRVIVVLHTHLGIISTLATILTFEMWYYWGRLEVSRGSCSDGSCLYVYVFSFVYLCGWVSGCEGVFVRLCVRTSYMCAFIFA